MLFGTLCAFGLLLAALAVLTGPSDFTGLMLALSIAAICVWSAVFYRKDHKFSLAGFTIVILYLLDAAAKLIWQLESFHTASRPTLAFPR